MTTTAAGTADPAGAIRPALGRFLYLYLVLFVALPVVGGIVFSNQLELWWTEQFDAPELEEHFGFRIEAREVVLPSGVRWRAMAIADVTPGGRFAEAGVHTDDLVACLYHGRGDFWYPLIRARDGYEAEFRVLSPSQLSAGCDGARRIKLEGRPLR